MVIDFTKMHGLGNDFMVINAIGQSIPSLPVSQLANRYTGIGFDQLLIITESTAADFNCIIYNSDGTEAEQCGNGLRCVGRYIHENKLIDTNHFRIQTKAGIFPILIHDYERVEIKLGEPSIVTKLTSFSFANQDWPMSIIMIGNPHAVIRVQSLTDLPNLTAFADAVSALPAFPTGANVGFMQVDEHGHLHLRTFERGAGETLACGSNACAAAVAAIANGWTLDLVDVHFKLGELNIQWAGDHTPIRMIGPAASVYKGQLSL